MQFPNLERERKLFASCLDLTPPDRSGYLDRECRGDTALRERIERLLDAHARATSSSGGLLRVPADDIPDLIGRYQLTRLIGEGGMGTVYEAEQQEPVRRTVALKIIKVAANAGSGGILSRFTAERQALAVMDHPNVAKVFDAGETLLGYPYFVMELVKGAPLNEYCDQRALPIRERLGLFMQLCHAVQHAHQKGVIHRDLKPSNVLVTDESGAPLVKVIDFGIAKAIGDPAAGLTLTSSPIGTPAYMSPEQAGMGARDIDTRSDIYSLGVILYELLSGTLPADPAETGYGAYLARLALGELKIAQPSIRVGPEYEISQRRGSTPQALRRLIQGDLDWIVMRALDADRSRRYDSANALADDIGRFLNEEPVTARRPTLSYRLAKFVRRHKFQTVAAAVAVVGLLSGAIAATVGYVRAIKAEATAREEAATAREVSDFLVNSFKISEPGEARGRTVTARELLDNATTRIDTELVAQPRVRRRLLTTLSRAHASLGLYRESEGLAGKALELRASGVSLDDLDAADAYVAASLAKFRLSQNRAAMEPLERALAIRTRILGPDHPQVAQALGSMGAIVAELEQFDKAIEYKERALAIYRKAYGENHAEVGGALRDLARPYLLRQAKGDPERRCELYNQSLPILEKTLGTSHPMYADNLDDIGLCHEYRRNFPEALRWMERSFETRKRVLGPQHAMIAFSHHNLGRCLSLSGKLKEAKTHFEQGFQIRESTLGRNHPLTGAIVESLAIAEARLGNLRKSREYFERALLINLAARGPDHSETLESHSNVGRILVVLKLYADALPHLREGARGRFFINWKERAFDPVRKHPGYLALVADQEKMKAAGQVRH